MAKSIAAEEKLVPTIPSLPAIFQDPPEEVKGRFIAPYVAFAHPKRKDEWDRIAAKYGTPSEGDVFLIRQNDIVPLPTAKLGLLKAKQYWVLANAAGEVQAVSFEERPKPYKEHIDAVVLVYLENEIVPANILFRSTKCPAGKTLNDALIKAATPAWADESQAHKDTLIVKQPFFRFYGLCTLGEKRTSKENGMPYRPYQAVIKPTSTPEWQLIKPFTEDTATMKKLDDVAQRFTYKMTEVQKKVPKTT